MFKKSLFLLLSLFLFISCSNEETTPEEGEDIIQNITIELNIDNDVVITSDEITITVTGEIPISNLQVLLDDNVLKNFMAPPFTFSVNTEDYADGAYNLKVDLYSNGTKVGSKTILVKIDNTGPVLNLINVANNEIICSETTITPQITDEISSVKSLQVYLEEELLLDTQNPSEFTFSLIPDNLSVGDSNLKFIMEDIQGNVSNDSINVKIAKKIITINFPDDFVRKDIDQIHVLLSDSNGKFLDSQTHSSGEKESLEFCSFQEFNNDTEFMISFVSDFDESIYWFYVYGNLTKEMLGNEIDLPARTAGITPAFPDLDVPFFNDNYYMRASTSWSSMIYTNQTFSGHLSRTFTNEQLGTNKTFIQYYNKFVENDYQWAYLEDLHTKFSLEQEDFTSNEVTHGSIAVNGTFLRPFMSMYGFESEAHYNAISGHMIYWNPALLGSSNGYNYSYANIFDYIFYSFKVKNYTIEGSGTPPSVVDVPNSTIDYTYYGNNLTFAGLPEFEVGRLRLNGTNSGLITTDNPSVGMEFIFNGESTHVIIPEIPEGLFPPATKEVFDNQAFEVIQGAAENYSSLANYKDYISKVLVTGKPFYKVSDKRERVFKSSVGTQLLPINEFPFYERF